ncbi:MAG TPA: LytS/YhcK type 5TM receptor domain-containing protein [Bacteroidota bacterium]|nr:LytS/YhcK type 5TM receptor domain-containing protein [Bacteroidota bacterium]
MVIIQLIYNLAVLVSVSVVSGFVDARWDHKGHTGKLLQGFTFGCIAILAMLNPYHFSPGIIFDGRSIVLSLCALFFGPVSGAIAGVMAIATRLIIGGGGAVMGVSVIGSSILLGLVFHRLRERNRTAVNIRNLYLFGLVVHFVMLALMMFLPKNFAWASFHTIAISVIVFYPVATVLIGKILISQEERAKYFNEVRESEMRYRNLLEVSPVGIAVHVGGKIVFTNPAGKKLLGADSIDQLIGKPIKEIIHPDQFETARARMLRMMAGEQGLYPAEELFVRLDGSPVNVEVVASALTYNGQSAVQVVVTDITERKQAEAALHEIHERLSQSEKMETIGQLAGGIAHDFNNVLAGIIGFTDMSLGLAPKGSRLEINLLKVLKAADRAKHLVQQILTYSRQSAPPRYATDLEPIVREALDLLRASIPTSVIIDAQLSNETKPVLADPTKIHEVMLNLATNAVHAMESKGTLSIRLYGVSLVRAEYGKAGEIAPGEYAVIEISDTGRGMDTATLSRAFDPFFTTKAVGEGTGMGLSVVLGIVQSHHGNIQVESATGRGTTVKIYFPATEEHSSGAADENSTGPFSGTERIVFVDDEPMLVEMNVDWLTGLGYTVTGFSDSQEAIRFIREHTTEFDLVITDQTMPNMTGIELAKEARKLRSDLPIILCTGYSRDVNVETAKMVGISLILMKPYGTQQLSKAIREVIESEKKEQ